MWGAASYAPLYSSAASDEYKIQPLTSSKSLTFLFTFSAVTIFATDLSDPVFLGTLIFFLIQLDL